MSDYNRINAADLDNHITGHYGEDQFPKPGYCPACKLSYEGECQLHIAAAEMLDALKSAHAMLVLMGVPLDDHAEGRKIATAIAKAEGR